MADIYGVSFQPGADNGSGTGQNREQGPPASPLQSAVKLLSLRLPSVVGARAISPQALLESPGSAGLGGPGGMSGEALIDWLRKLMTQSGASVPEMTPRQPGSMPTFGGPGTPSERPQVPNIPPPVIRPGEEPPPPDLPRPREPQPSASEPPSAGVPSPFDIQNPFSRPGRNPRLAEKFGFDL